MYNIVETYRVDVIDPLVTVDQLEALIAGDEDTGQVAVEGVEVLAQVGEVEEDVQQVPAPVEPFVLRRAVIVKMMKHV